MRRKSWCYEEFVKDLGGNKGAVTHMDLHEMKQWELPTVSPKILPILRVTPTKYLLLRDYALRGVWSASG